MSITISNWKLIHDAPTNKSISKMAYSFSKSKRFGKEKENKSQIFYNINNTISKRSTTFGYGSKYDFTKDLPVSPPPTAYNTVDSLKGSKSSKRFYFGQGREEMIVTGPLAQTINNKNPGPGAYENLPKESRIAYSIRSKVKEPQTEAQKIPGPGTYEKGCLFTKTGSVFYSKHSSHKAVNFNSGGQRFKDEQNWIPGPGRYDSSTIQLNKQGKYSLSKLHNSGVRTFGNEKRNSNSKRCQTPGPGNYQMPSEFGYYVSRNQFQRLHTVGPKSPEKSSQQ